MNCATYGPRVSPSDKYAHEYQSSLGNAKLWYITYRVGCLFSRTILIVRPAHSVNRTRIYTELYTKNILKLNGQNVFFSKHEQRKNST